MSFNFSCMAKCLFVNRTWIGLVSEIRNRKNGLCLCVGVLVTKKLSALAM